MINGLTIASSHSVGWEIEILLKFAKIQKQNNSLLQGFDKQNKAKSSASYFIRQPDIGVCCVVSKNEKTNMDDVYVCSDSEIEEKYSNFIHRSVWKASGQRFFVGNCLISVGFIEHSGSAVKPCLELSYCPIEINEKDEKDDEIQNIRTDDELTLIAHQLHRVAIDLLIAHAAPNTIPILTSRKISPSPSTSGTIDKIDNNILVNSVGGRALQWLALVQ